MWQRVLIGLGVFMVLHFIFYGAARYFLGGFIEPTEVTVPVDNELVLRNGETSG
jgi:hypothetical protein